MPKKSKLPTRKSPGSATLAIHAGENHHGVNGPVAPPIVYSSTFTFSSTAEMKRWAEGRSKAYIYTRYGNPTLAVAEAKLAALEGGEAAVVTASGMAAISSALLSVLRSGDEVIATRALYGGAYRLLRDLFPRFGITVKHVDANLDGADALVTPRARALYVETPTNPTLQMVDLRRAVSLAKRHKLVSLVDNTFASPVLQRPLELGFDLVMHSATKYLAGHSDVVAGAVVGSCKLVDGVRNIIIYLGASMDPSAAFRLIRGLKTLELRVKRQCESAMAVAKLSGKASSRRARPLSRPALASRPRPRAPPDARRLRRHVGI